MRRAGRSGRSGLLAGLVLVLVAGGCSGGEDAPAVGERPDLPDPPARFNPCDGLDLPAVSTLFDTTFSNRTGTPEAPSCTFSPQREGDPAVDVNYQLFPGDLEELMGSFGALDEEALTRVNGPGLESADDARVIVDVQDGTLAVTGFVQNGDLVQVVNALDPAPFERDLLRVGVRTLLADLATHADETGLE